eukprot:1161038-Pelagomonas_calceolata.AAC.5
MGQRKELARVCFVEDFCSFHGDDTHTPVWVGSHTHAQARTHIELPAACPPAVLMCAVHSTHHRSHWADFSLANAPDVLQQI